MEHMSSVGYRYEPEIEKTKDVFLWILLKGTLLLGEGEDYIDRRMYYFNRI